MIAAWIFVGFCLILSLFQLALIGGAPWGRLTQGGGQHGALRLPARVLAAVSIAVVVFMALCILSAAGRWPYWPAWTGWVTLGLVSLTTVANGISPSRPERVIWTPVSLAMLFCALHVLIG